jgi:RND family efflux transporter MFP subunit
LPEVTVATPLQETVAPATGFLGQFSAVDSVELRAQVGGTLTEIGFRDGKVVHKGDLLFVIDPRPFQIRLEQAMAQLQTAVSRKALADAELWRAQQLRQSSFGTVENVDQRTADQRGAEASIAAAKAAIRDAQLDLEFSRMTAPFDGRIGAHQASVGSLVSGSRGGTTASTLLATVVSLDPIYIDFEMSESDYLAFQAARHDVAAGEPVAISLGGDGHFGRRGRLDFIDNVVDRSSGTIHARATVPNPELNLTPGQFARVRLALGRPAPALLVPAAAVIPDQSRQIVMTVGEDGKVVPKPVETGEIHRGLRIIKSGLAANDRVVINGLVRVRPGAVVKPVPGTIAPAGEDE